MKPYNLGLSGWCTQDPKERRRGRGYASRVTRGGPIKSLRTFALLGYWNYNDICNHVSKDMGCISGHS
jgi:hypothetical protein